MNWQGLLACAVLHIVEPGPDRVSGTPALREAFLNFPMPAALLDDSGEARLLNRRFLDSFAPDTVRHDDLRQVLARPDGPGQWHPLRLPRRGGDSIQCRAQATRLADGLLLAVDDLQLAENDADVRALQSRIRELERSGATDPLTGAWNRTHLERVIDNEVSRSLRSHQPLSLILFDIDHFKHVNDTWGHAAGDQVLRELAGETRQGVRSADLLFRWGGEEFLVLCPNTSYRNAGRLAESLRRRVEARGFSVAGRITISLGVAEHLSSESTADWFGRVDAAMYAAKKAGRNRVQTDARGDSDRWNGGAEAAPLRLVWSEAMECGDPRIDTEHRALFELGNALIAASVRQPADAAAVQDALGRLLAHIELHFAHEEGVLAGIGYPRLEQHRQAHARLLRRARELRDEVQAGAQTLGALLDFVAGEVVARHLNLADRDYFPLLGWSGAKGGER